MDQRSRRGFWSEDLLFAHTATLHFLVRACVCMRFFSWCVRAFAWVSYILHAFLFVVRSCFCMRFLHLACVSFHFPGFPLQPVREGRELIVAIRKNTKEKKKEKN